MLRSDYNRAKDRWLCGNKANGCPCRNGPDHQGNCGAATQCLPVKIEHRWHCTRSIVQGGNCEQGPTPDGQCCMNEAKCAPLAGYNQKKRTYLQLTTLLLLTFLLLGLSPVLIEDFADPGPLAQPHAGIAQCQSCHVEQSTLDLSVVIKNAFNPIAIAEHNQQCLACHAMGENSINPHQLARIDRDNSDIALPEPHQQGIACATCHKEHQEQLIPDAHTQTSYCQSCHDKPVYRFPENHPEFINYPIKGVKRISFNHKDHIERFFSELPEYAPDSCSSCHGISQNGIPTVADFENSCQSCHQKDVFTENLASGPKGFAVLSIPGLDIITLQANNIDIGQWPQWSEEPLNPVWLSLLSKRNAARSPQIYSARTQPQIYSARALQQTDLLDLNDANPETLNQIQSLALNIKQYLHQLSINGSNQTKENWTLQLSQGELRSAINSWFPELDAEIALINAGTPPPTQAVNPNGTSTLAAADDSDEASFDFDDSNLLDGEDNGESLGDLFSDENSLEDDSNLDDLFGDNGQDSNATEQPSTTNETATISAEQWMKQGGWYFQNYALYYRSTGHRDSNLKHWISKTPELFNEDSSGRCLKCHSIDSDNPSSWKTGQRNTIAAKLTSFDHAQHMNMINTNGCQSCHAIAEYSEQKHDFEPIKKQQCSSCHNEQTQLNQCSACHNYHLPWTTIDFSNKSLFDVDKGEYFKQPMD